MSPAIKRILAVDFGDRRTGMAATDPTGTIAVPLDRIDAADDDTCADLVAAVAKERNSEVIVVGMPLLLDGEAGARARRTEEFVRRLSTRVQCPVATVDESHTTDEAHNRLKASGMKAARRKQLADSVAALVILERYRSGC